MAKGNKVLQTPKKVIVKEGSIQWLKNKGYKGEGFDRIISDLKFAFANDYTIVEAIRHAGITSDTYYRWLKESDEFAKVMQQAQDEPFKVAKNVVMTSIKAGDEKAAQWLLERRQRDLYSTKTVEETSNLNINTEVKLSEDEQESIRAAFRELRGEEDSSGD